MTCAGRDCSNRVKYVITRDDKHELPACGTHMPQVVRYVCRMYPLASAVVRNA